MPRGPNWTAEDLSRLRDLYVTLPKEELLSAFPGRSFQAIRMQAKHMGICRPAGLAFSRQSCFRRTLTEAELAYIAGIIDGEGHITVIRSQRKNSRFPLYTPRVGITNQSEVLIRWLDERVAW